MWSAKLETRWQQLADEVFTGVKEWRLQHPKATFAEIEAAVDERLARVRARMLQDVALTSAAANIRTASAADQPVCPECGEPLEQRAEDTRHLTTTYEQSVTLTRSYGVCPSCGTGLFPPG